MNNNELLSMGQFEDGPNKELVVRILGRRIGLCHGWLHWGAWCVICPDFVPDHEFSNVLAGKVTALPSHNMALMVDFYSGEWKLLGNFLPYVKNEEFTIMLTGQIESKEMLS